MMKGLELFQLCRKVTTIPLNRGIHANSVLLMNRRRRGVPQNIETEPGIRRRKTLLQEDSNDSDDIEDVLDEEVDMMNVHRAYDLNERTKFKEKVKLQRVITAKKFFAPRAQPLMLTCNDRECIRYLHKQDPVQWDIKTLSESFPATPATIKKIIKGKWKITPERAQKLDSKVQENWKLLAEGKLDADSDVLEHLKQFINRKEVLMEHIKNTNFYLPEVKKERVWNGGEFSGLLGRYEKALEKLIKESEAAQKPEMISDGTEKGREGEEKSSAIDLVHEKINQAACTKSFENKDSFLYGNVTKFYSRHTTLEELEDQILKKADSGNELGVLDKAILENKLDTKSTHVETVTETRLPNHEKVQERPNQYVRTENRQYKGSNRTSTGQSSDSDMSYSKKYSKMKFRETEVMFEEIPDFPPNDGKTLCSDETKIGKLLHNLKSTPEGNQESKEENESVKEKPKIDFSDPERVARENEYYNKEVKDIEETAFWNSNRNSQEKAMTELQKRPHEGPVDTQNSKVTFITMDSYPERIKIPKDKWRSGLTFRVKDCFYDDDGEFLYRVPGMTK